MNLTVCDVCKKELDEYAINIEAHKKHEGGRVSDGSVIIPIGSKVQVFQGHLCEDHWSEIWKLLHKEQSE